MSVGMSLFFNKKIFFGPLDRLKISPVVAYSVRRLRRGYKGPCLRVRRSSDNLEKDINFLSNGWLDTNDLLTFVGSGNGFVTRWYDQIGTNNAIMTNPSLQPQIVNTGNIIIHNSRPGVRFISEGTSFFNRLIFTRFHTLSTPYLSSSSVYSYNANNNGTHLFTGSSYFGLGPFNTGINLRYGVTVRRTNFIEHFSSVFMSLNTVVSRYSESNRINVRDYVNKAIILNVADQDADFASFTQYQIGARDSLSHAQVNISELLFFADTALTAAQRDALQDNQMQAFNI